MTTGISILILSIAASILLWFGYSLVVRFGKLYDDNRDRPTPQSNKRSPTNRESIPGAPKTCPVCSLKLTQGERVRSSVYPSMNGNERLMHIMGCPYCLAKDSDRPRHCPVCGASLKPDEILVARMFDKPGRSHVHVLGCSHCKRTGVSHK